MHSTNIWVAVRTRPTRASTSDFFVIDEGKETIDIRSANTQDVFHFKFNKVFHNATQETVFFECLPPILEGAIDGYNGTVMAYGQVRIHNETVSLSLSPSFSLLLEKATDALPLLPRAL